MVKLYDVLLQDIRFQEGLNACMNCGVCTAICPASEFYKYDPRQICDLVQSKDEEKIEELLKSDTIWYCGQCMSCKTRCPRGNVPGLIIMVLRKVSQELGYFTESEKGRQQFAIKRVIGENILNTGYCAHVNILDPKMHPEQGPIWKWYKDNIQDVTDRLGANYNRLGPGALRKIPEENLAEIRKIYEVTGGMDFYNKIEKYSKEKAKDLKMSFDEQGINNEYFYHVYLENKNNHQK
ncbi:MAG: 4Fe-4S dicluster domain-containing protein [Bacteroidales bacterium]|jgi:heterodisulfide reductase subunit C|nr:4Fe-4S dicluster domain-containing protein [Bacteroidales bacterium]